MNRFPVEVLALGLMLAGVTTASEQPVENDDPPSMELLEFLGEWTTPEGEVFDPLLLAEDLPEIEVQDEEN